MYTLTKPVHIHYLMNEYAQLIIMYLLTVETSFITRSFDRVMTIGYLTLTTLIYNTINNSPLPSYTMVYT